MKKHSIAENTARLINGEMQIDGWHVWIEQNQRRWYSAKLTGPQINYVYAPENDISLGSIHVKCPPGIKTFCADLAEKIADLNS